MIQAPNCINPYIQPIPAPSYNAVKIDVHNPQVNAPGQQPQYAPVTNPYYEYPQAQLYSYPQQVCQPCQQQVIEPAPAIAQTVAPATVQTVAPAIAQTVAPAIAQTVAPQPVIQQQNINTPAPVVTQPQSAEAPKVEVIPPQQMTPQVDLNSFIAKLTNPDFEVQANVMEEIANMVKENPQKATELLDEKIVSALNNIIAADSTKLAGPTADQIAAREKLMKGELLSDADKKLATTITPMEQAERNKSYAMFTAAIMQKLYGDEVAKLTGSTVPLTELPGAVQIVEQLKNNPNPMVRTSALEALSYIQQPAYKKDLTTLFTIAKNDQDKNVQEAAATALAKLEQIQAA